MTLAQKFYRAACDALEMGPAERGTKSELAILLGEHRSNISKAAHGQWDAGPSTVAKWVREFNAQTEGTGLEMRIGPAGEGVYMVERGAEVADG